MDEREEKKRVSSLKRGRNGGVKIELVAEKKEKKIEEGNEKRETPTGKEESRKPGTIGEKKRK